MLEADGTFIYEDVCNNSINSVKWRSPSKGFLNSKTGKFEQCLCHEYETFWDDNGDFYGGNEYKESKRTDKEIKFVHGNTCFAAFNSAAKSAEVSIYKHGVKKQIGLHPGLCLWFLKPYIEFHYQSNPMGDILKRTWKIEFLKKDKNMKGYCICWMSPYRMIKFSLNKFNRHRRHYYQNPNSFYRGRELYNDFKPLPDWDKRWWYVMVNGIYQLFIPN
jgi:hypothetical protein